MKRLSYLFILLTLLIVLLCIFGCTPSSTPSEKKPSQYTSGYITCYGHCYDSLPSVGVVMLDLYDSSLSLDSAGKMQGTGYNLCLTDIFVPDSMLVDTTYRTATTGEPFTMLPGQNHDGMPHGIYLLHKLDAGYTTDPIDSATMTVRHDSVWHIDFTGYYRPSDSYYKQTYHATFSGALKQK